MNKKAKEIGCLNTHFVNPHGFFDENHYTTPYDMALILKYAMKYDKFKQIVETLTWDLPITNKTNEVVTLRNTNRLIDKDYKVFYEYAVGGKTGYTIESRGTFVGYTKKDDKLVIVANFDGSQNINGQNARFLDTITLSEYAFNNFNKEKIIEKDTIKYNILDENSNTKYTLNLKNDIYAITNNSNYKIITPIFNVSYDKDGNIHNDVFLNIRGDGLNISNNFETEITNSEKYVSKAKFNKFIPYILLVLLIIIFLLLITKLFKRNKKSRKHIKKFE